MNELLERIKRLFAPRPRPPAETAGEATADRPPPAEAEASPVRPAITEMPTEELIPPATARAPVDDDELAELRAALEAVAEPVSRPEPEIPPAPPTPVEEPIPSAVADAVPAEAVPDVANAVETAATASESADTAPPLDGRVGEALVLTMGTPPVTFTVAKTSATLGRGQENTIRLDDLSVSRRHARIAYRQGGYWLSDLGSMGGTWVDGIRLNAPRRLAAGELIDIGLLRLTVGFAGGSKSAGTSHSAGSAQSAGKSRAQSAGQVRRRR
ncbi:MAG TPA: FHA domain-containing protein [Candidatus Limnocylindria bacterium]|nr:FHA domain-containing protein [Candidatus Limnocylindria bacterium]